MCCQLYVACLLLSADALETAAHSCVLDAMLVVGLFFLYIHKYIIYIYYVILFPFFVFIICINTECVEDFLFYFRCLVFLFFKKMHFNVPKTYWPITFHMENIIRLLTFLTDFEILMKEEKEREKYRKSIQISLSLTQHQRPRVLCQTRVDG